MTVYDIFINAIEDLNLYEKYNIINRYLLARLIMDKIKEAKGDALTNILNIVSKIALIAKKHEGRWNFNYSFYSIQRLINTNLENHTIEEINELSNYAKSIIAKNRYVISTLSSNEPEKYKQSKGKSNSLGLPIAGLRSIIAVRTFGAEKYPDTRGWRNVSEEKLTEALIRHLLNYIENPDGVDEESGLSHISHLATNALFLATKDYEKRNGKKEGERTFST